MTTVTITADQTGGVRVHLEAGECELLIRLASDADVAADQLNVGYADSPHDYVSLSVALGRRIKALAAQDPAILAAYDQRTSLTRSMVDLILSAEPA